MSKHLNFRFEGFEKHTCHSRREGDWLIYECPDCDYVRKWNLKTSEMNLVNSGDLNALHRGHFEPVGVQLNKYNPN